MPIGSDPDDSIPYALEYDADKPADARPVFLLKFLTERETRKVSGLIRQATEPGADEERIPQLLDEATAVGLKGWRNMTHRGAPVVFGRDALGDFLSLPERWELVYAVLHEPQLKEADRKKSLRQSTSGSGKSAGAAAPPASV